LLGANISPALNWTRPPAGTAELVLIVQVPDVPIGKPATHALALGIGFTLDDVIAASKGHAIGRARLDGTYEIR
jgi:phosphatidylethanolamine-binding protein (PEBP) family uncharacterized protein